MPISNLEETYSKEYRVFDESGNIISQRLIGSQEELVGIGIDFYVTLHRNELLTWNEKSQRITSRTFSDFTVKNVSGNSINLIKRNEMVSYDKNFKLLNTRTI
jgi:hypothetical protein